MRPQVLRPFRPFAGLAAVLLLALAPSACRRSPSPPSPEYEQASRQWRELYAQKLDDAYLDPSTGEIEALLQRVPADSLDANNARELLQRIEQGRARMQQAAEERKKAVASAREVPNVDPTRTNIPRPPEPEKAAEAPDAGPPDAGLTGPQIGSPASELVSGYRGCFQRGMPIEVQGRGMREAWELADRTSCRLEFPSHANTVLLIEEGRVLALLPKSSVRTVQRTADGGTPPSTPPADAGS